MIPLVSIIGGVLTYLAVGDRVFSSCAPATHGRVWRGVAYFIGHTLLAPVACLCLCCAGSARGAMEGVAAGILKRLGDMEEDRKKAGVARSKLKLIATPSSGSMGGGDDGGGARVEGGGDGEGERGGEGVGVGEGEDSTTTTHNPLLFLSPSATGSGKESSGSGGEKKGVWKRYQDGTDVWYVHSVTQESRWSAPAEEDASSSSSGNGNGKAALDVLPLGWERRVSKTNPGLVFYVNKKEGKTTWEVPTG